MALGGIFGGIDTLVFGKGSKKVYGSKPVVPEAPTLENAQKDAVTANIQTFPEAQKLATTVNTFNQEELDRLMDLALPGGRDKIQSNISSMLSGKLPDGVSNLVMRTRAERASAGGFAGSEAAANLTARDLGLTSLQLTQEGITSAEKWLSEAAAPKFNVTSMFISPTQRYTAASDKFSRDLYSAKVDAAPDPVKRGEFDSTMALLGMILSAYGGGAGYQNTYKGVDGGNGGAGGSPYAGPGGGPGQAPNTGGWYIGNQGSGWGFGRSGNGNMFAGQAPGPG